MTSDGRERTPTAQPDTEARAKLLELLTGYQRSQMVYVAAKLGLADLLADGPRSAAQLAEATGTHPPSLRRLLRALAGFGLFRELDDRRYEIAPLGQPLRRDAPHSLRAMALVQGDDNYRGWGELLSAVKTGRTGWDKAYGLTASAYRDQNPDANERFNAYMAESARRRLEAFFDTYALPDTGLVVDIGGGDGTLLLGVLERHPSLRGVLFDLPRVIEDANPRLKAHSLGDRLQIQAGDFFREVPSGGDLYILSLILHNWEDARALEILHRCREAMPKKAKLLVLDQIVPDGPPQPSMSDLNMLVICGGHERTALEWRDLLTAGEFGIVSIRTSPPLIEATPA